MRWRVVRHSVHYWHMVNLCSSVISWTVNIESWEVTRLGSSVISWTVNIESWEVTRLGSGVWSRSVNIETWEVTGLSTNVLGWALNIESWKSCKRLSCSFTDSAKTWMITCWTQKIANGKSIHVSMILMRSIVLYTIIGLSLVISFHWHWTILVMSGVSIMIKVVRRVLSTAVKISSILKLLIRSKRMLPVCTSLNFSV